MSLYQILGVQPDCTEAELKKAYRRSVMKYHPDKQAKPSEEATQKFLQRSTILASNSFGAFMPRK